MSDIVAAISGGVDDSGPQARVREVGRVEPSLLSAAWAKIAVGVACTVIIGTGGALTHLMFDHNSRLAVLENQNIHNQRQLDKIDGKIDQLLVRGK